MRLIDADAFYEAQKARCGRPPLIGTCTKDNTFLDDELDKAPTVDAVEVVRCKDCKWYVEDREFPPFCDNNICGMQHPNDETFCSYGERRKEK